MPAQVRSKRHPHDDAPDTAESFRTLVLLAPGPQHDIVRDQIVVAWLPMADRLAGRFRNRGENTEDLRQVAAIGLIKAVDRYDPDRGKAFESYAVPTITGEIKRHFRDHTWAMHVPRRVQELRNRVRSALRDLSQTAPDHRPTRSEIAARAGLSEEDTQDGLEALESYAALSLDAELPGGESGYSLGDTLGTADPALDTVIDREAVKPGIKQLSERDKVILYQRFFGNMTQAAIAEELGISQMHVSRLISLSCERLRDQVMREAA
ncbi:SigB/SigF/SigG family RNA polymerase sigma factor [Streptomyces sp. MBT53]|uniref:SigB/SigF/SigG family RNA polymerase sigma factor n=1 Tax=Streptomyces sp. MBT53 TaxID=1488384 RepID=UPI00191259D4|nr:SigB/SigF/SigG family RNA polymerase sigma factor [Streptomyces sp. MBT53]MBK6014043.1 SigB/SigF/SigG family RNA polymerase sigma factor [Streptomyces sp. MBT53]